MHPNEHGNAYIVAVSEMCTG